ncbi:MAG: DMT family transporter [Betaproteobacteria bacterium]
MSERSRRAAGVACIVASAVAFGTMAIMARVAYASGVDTVTLLALRFGIAAVVMAALVRARGLALPRGRMLAALVALGALGYGGQAFAFFTALTLAPAGLVALLLYLHPAAVALLSAAFLHERLTPAKLAALAAALAGMALTVGPSLGGAAPAAQPAGIAFAVAAAAIYAVYIVAGARLGRTVPALAMSTVVIGSAGALFAVAALVRGPVWPQAPAGWLAIAGIALVSTVAAITLFFAGLERIGPTRASTLSTVEPLVTVTLAAALLGETIAPVQQAGGALILGAVVLLARAHAEPAAA